MSYTPLQLAPVLVAKPWGGHRLRQGPGGATIGERWSVADLDPRSTPVPDPFTRVRAGRHDGRRLSDLIAADARGLLGASRCADGRFPLLVKTLDARQHLSVQVHPPATYVRGRAGLAVKTETWVVLDAEPGAELMIGFRDGVSLADVTAVIGTPDLVPLLRRVPAVPGAVHHLPAGLVHALGAGVVVAEVQTASDTTFRLYDWTREYGRPERALHLREGLDVLATAWDLNAGASAPVGPEDALVTSPHYRVARRRLRAGSTTSSPAGRARVVIALDGSVVWGGAERPLGAGGSAVLPAAWDGTIEARTDATVLEVEAA